MPRKVSQAKFVIAELALPWSREQVAEYLGVSERTVARWTKKGYLSVTKVGYRTYYNPHEVMMMANMS